VNATLEQGTTLLGIWGGASQRDRKALLAGKVTGELVRDYAPMPCAVESSNATGPTSVRGWRRSTQTSGSQLPH
jgi:hypothetical protein